MTAPGDDLLALARSDPTRALARIDELLGEATDDPKRLSVLHRARGQAAMVIADYPLAAAGFEASVAAARMDGDPATANRIAISLAGAYFDRGEPDRAYATLDEVDHEAKGELLGISLGQRAGLLVDQGRLDEALAYFKLSMPHLEGGEDRFHLANSHQNMGNLHLESGNPASATDAYRAALETFTELDMPIKSAGVLHNLARIAGQRGDLIGAIEAFEESERLYRDGVGGRSHHGADKCEVLIQAGLLDEAVAESAELKRHATRTSDPRQLGYAHFLTSLAHSIAGHRVEAIAEAHSAVRVFSKNTSMVLAGRAQLIELECLDPDPAHAATALKLAEVFSNHGHHSGEVSAISVACRHSAQLSESDRGRLRKGLTHARSQVRQASRIGLARVCLGDQPEEAIALLREALDDISRFVGLQASAPVRRSMATHLTEIQALGLSLLVGLGDGERLAQWIDDTRLVSSTLPTLRPVSDRRLAEMVARLRAIETDPSGGDLYEAARLEAQILRRSRLAAAQTSSGPYRSPAPSAPIEALVLRFYLDGTALSRIDSGPGGHSLLHLGPESEIRTSMTLLGADLRRLARSPGDASLISDIDSAVGALADRLLPDSGCDLVICPPPRLLSFPWSVLARPGQAITVAPSMHYWTRGRDYALAPATQPGPSTLTAIAGPGLRHALPEVSALAADREGAVSLVGSASSVQATIDALGQSDVVHLACHGVHHRSSPRFSALRLADGSLYAYDIEQIERTAPVVVLTACDGGVERALSGEEAIGIGTALLSRGTRSVLTGMTLVPDSDLTVRFSSLLHGYLDSGMPPARSLASAIRDASQGEASRYPLATFTCLGWG